MSSLSAFAGLIETDDYITDEDTGLTWLNQSVTYGMTVDEVESAMADNTLYDDTSWRYATWDEVLDFYLNAADEWFVDLGNGYWEFTFDNNDNWTHDALSGLEKILGFEGVALNDDGELAANNFSWISSSELTMLIPGSTRTAMMEGFDYENWDDQNWKINEEIDGWDEYASMEGYDFSGDSAELYFIVADTSEKAVAIPEPGSALLFSLALFGMLKRRKSS